MEQKFTHLHTHSHYSLLDGLSKISDLVEKAKEDGMEAIALTDHGAMYGAIDFYMECTKAGIKPIIGVEAYMAVRNLGDKEPGVDNKRYHLTLLAKNFEGYKNLMKLVTISQIDGYYYKPRMDKEILKAHSEGIICLSGCPSGELAKALFNQDLEKGREIVRSFIDIFGKENFFLEAMGHFEMEGYDKVVEDIKTLSKEFDLPIVGTWDAHYMHKEDWEAQETLVAINTGGDVQSNKMKMKGNYSFITSEEAKKAFENIPGAYENTKKVADMCNLELTLGKFVFPIFPLPPEVTPDMRLHELCVEGLTVRGLEDDEKAKERLEYELGIIAFKGYATYFLVVHDLIRHARENDIYYNIRGSVAGSMTTYTLGITKVNPLVYNIPFERFLNPERPSAPDIDMDFADNRRDEIIDYARHKYGEKKVAQIGTFGTMAARGSVRDVARALGYPYGVGDRISKMIPMGAQGFPMTIERALNEVPELKEMYDNDRETSIIIDMAKKIEGGARHISVHAAGVVIGPTDLTDYTPLQFDPKGGKLITQYDMYSVGEDGAGLTKFDFLGIRNLSILKDAVTLVDKIYNIKVDIDDIDLADERSFKMLARGETEGLFQLNGAGMTKWLKELRPSTIHDINAMVALYRPGPMQFIPDYIARKHNSSLISYLDPALEDILKTTYGILVYQDDLLLMAHHLAGYSWGEVDKFRKAVGKKIPAEMQAQREKFIKGCVKTSGWSEKKATEIWSWIEPFAAYGFNKAHSASYGLVAYQTAFMKANFPVAYMCACMTAESGDVDQIAIYVHECERMKIKVLPPNINESFGVFTVIKETDKTIEESRVIRFGLYTIKNLGTDIADAIIEERKKNGPFSSIGNFLDRITHKNLNRKSLESLIKAGAMDEFGERGLLMANSEALLEYNRAFAQKSDSQTSLFGLGGMSAPELRLRPTEPVDLKTRLAWEKDLLGLYISGHPLEAYKEKLSKCNSILSIKREGKKDAPIKVCGVVEEVKRITTKNNDYMLFVRITDLTGSIETILFPKNYKDFAPILIEDALIVIAGKVSLKNDEKSIIIEAVKNIE
jgi:DNA polymerase III subunit alpha